jgi:hypothetical protein
MVTAGDKQSIARSGGTWLPPKLAAEPGRSPRSKHRCDADWCSQ